MAIFRYFFYQHWMKIVQSNNFENSLNKLNIKWSNQAICIKFSKWLLSIIFTILIFFKYRLPHWKIWKNLIITIPWLPIYGEKNGLSRPLKSSQNLRVQCLQFNCTRISSLKILHKHLAWWRKWAAWIFQIFQLLVLLKNGKNRIRIICHYSSNMADRGLKI